MPNISNRQIRREIIRQMIIKECACQDDEMSWDHPEHAGHGKVFDHNGPEAESDMIRSNLYTMSKKARSMHDMIGMSDDLPEWVQEKIAVASAMIDSVNDYLDYEYNGSSSHADMPDMDDMDDDYEEFEVPHDDMDMDDMDMDDDEDDEEQDEAHFDLLGERDEDEMLAPWKPLRQSTGIMFFEDDQD